MKWDRYPRPAPNSTYTGGGAADQSYAGVEEGRPLIGREALSWRLLSNGRSPPPPLSNGRRVTDFIGREAVSFTRPLGRGPHVHVSFFYWTERF